jgi:hypothetical protein
MIIFLALKKQPPLVSRTWHDSYHMKLSCTWTHTYLVDTAPLLCTQGIKRSRVITRSWHEIIVHDNACWRYHPDPDTAPSCAALEIRENAWRSPTHDSFCRPQNSKICESCSKLWHVRKDVVLVISVRMSLSMRTDAYALKQTYTCCSKRMDTFVCFSAGTLIRTYVSASLYIRIVLNIEQAFWYVGKHSHSLSGCTRV